MYKEIRAKLKSTGEVFEILQCRVKSIDGDITDVCLNVPAGSIYGWYPIDKVELIEVEVEDTTFDANKIRTFYDPERNIMTLGNLPSDKAEEIMKIIA